MAKGTKKKSSKKRDRRERRFEPRVTTNPKITMGTGLVGAIVLGAGFYGQFVRPQTVIAEPLTYAPPMIAVGAVITAIAIWIGTTSEASIRVGDSGMAKERGGIERMPWYGVTKVGWDENTTSVLVHGTVDGGASAEWSVSTRVHPHASAWIVKEARARIPKVVDIPDSAKIPDAVEAGEPFVLEPPQVVGRHCASSDTVIAYEPDARLCPQCERAYHKDHVPADCACGFHFDTAKDEVESAAASADAQA